MLPLPEVSKGQIKDIGRGTGFRARVTASDAFPLFTVCILGKVIALLFSEVLLLH